MKKILFINGTVRENSRTLELARAVIDQLEGDIEEVDLIKEEPMHHTPEKLKLRDELIEKADYSHPMFDYAKQFAEADEIVVAAPYWDLLFPAVVRSYFEAICVGGVTFNFNDGRPNSLCKAKRLIYVTTAGGPIFKNLGFEYVDALCRTFFEINDTLFIKAEGLDITGVDPIAILEKAKKEIKL